jgi:hypothetical protein
MSNREVNREQVLRDLIRQTMALENRGRQNFQAKAFGQAAAYLMYKKKRNHHLKNKDMENAMRTMKRTALNRQRNTQNLKHGTPAEVMNAIKRGADASVVSKNDMTQRLGDYMENTLYFERYVDSHAQMVTALILAVPRSSLPHFGDAVWDLARYAVWNADLRLSHLHMMKAMVQRGVDPSVFGVRAIDIMFDYSDYDNEGMDRDEAWATILKIIRELMPESPAARRPYLQKHMAEIFGSNRNMRDVHVYEIRDLLGMGARLEPGMLKKVLTYYDSSFRLDAILRRLSSTNNKIALFRHAGVRLARTNTLTLRAKTRQFLELHGLVDPPKKRSPSPARSNRQNTSRRRLK